MSEKGQKFRPPGIGVMMIMLAIVVSIATRKCVGPHEALDTIFNSVLPGKKVETYPNVNQKLDVKRIDYKIKPFKPAKSVSPKSEIRLIKMDPVLEETRYKNPMESSSTFTSSKK